MERRKVMKLGIFGAVAAGILGVAGSALARHRGGFGCHGGDRAEFMKKMVNAHVDEALDAAKVEGAARDTVHGEVDKVFAAISEVRTGHQEDMDQMLDLFTADTLDRRQLDSIRSEHVAKMQKVSDTIADAISNVHDALTPDQRKALVEYVKAKRARFAPPDEK